MTTATHRRTDLMDKRMLNMVQSRFPMTDRPYLDMAEALGTTEEDMIQRVAYQKKKNVIRTISAIFDTRRLGYKTTLVAFRLPPARWRRVLATSTSSPA